MKNINYVLVQPELNEWSKEANAKIRDQSRSLGFFIGKNLKDKKIKSCKFSGVFFEGYNDISGKVVCESSKFLTVPVLLIEKEFNNSKSGKEINEYLISAVEEGLANLGEKYKEIVSCIKESIIQFRGAGYICSWTHKAKKIRENKIEVRMECFMDISAFNLSLVVRSKEEVLFREIILSTPPNEYAFKHRFRDIVINGQECYITDFLNRKWAHINLTQPYQVNLYAK